jgi:hypothetical protein
MRSLATSILFLILFSSCQVKVQHPGAIDSLDNDTYDTLLIAQSVLDNTKVAIKQGKLPDYAKSVSNNAGIVYNTLHELWLDYRSNPTKTTAEKIIDATSRINQLISELRGLGVNP